MSLKTKLLVVLLAVALIPATASATVTRVEGLGGWPGTAYIVKDASNPVQFPSTLAYYSHLLYAEFAKSLTGTKLDRVGAWYGFGEGKCVFGFDIFDRGKPDYMGMPDINGDGTLPYRLNVRWAKPFNDFILGAALSLFHESYLEEKYDQDPGPSEDFVDSKWEHKSTVIGLKVGATALDNLLDVALNFEFPSWTSTDVDGTTLSENDGSSHIDFAARYWYHYGDKTTLIPHFEVVMHNEGYANDAKSGMSVKGTEVRLGVGHNWKPVEAVLVVWEIGAVFGSYKYGFQENNTYLGMINPPPATPWPDWYTSDKTVSVTNLPYWRVGWEGRVYKWIKVRAGAEKTWVNSKWEIYREEPAFGSTVTNMYFGGDLNFGPVTIQYLLDHDFVRRGPNFISGECGPLFHRFSLFYKVPK